ncbi:MAG: hypothetical protein ABI885_18120 [Gammaproteobacteria bacterium]
MLSLLAVSTLMLAVTNLSFAQAPPRETPRPQDIDPAVDTSRAGATSATPEAPRPQDIDPAVDTSRAGASQSAPATETATPSAKKPAPPKGAATANGANGPAGAVQPGGAARTEAKGKTRALDRLELDTTQITGNRELPKVLYIVPWKRADLGDLVGKPVNSLLDEVLAPVDRDVFKRENRYYRALTPDGSQAGNKAASGQPDAPTGATSTPSPTPSNASGSAASSPRDER